jgi:hypothetical protein
MRRVSFGQRKAAKDFVDRIDAHRLRTVRHGYHVLLLSSAADLINDIAAYENVDLILVSAHDEALSSAIERRIIISETATKPIA